WMYAFYARLFFAFFGLFIVAWTPESRVSTPFFLFVLGVSVLGSFASTVQFVGMGSFFTRISDPAIGGTYMTLLNTLSNLGGTWPHFFVLQAVEYYTVTRCEVPSSAPAATQAAAAALRHCSSDSERHACAELGGACAVTRDGYYSVGAACAVLGLLLLVTVVRPQVLRLQALPHAAWRLPRRARRGAKGGGGGGGGGGGRDEDDDDDDGGDGGGGDDDGEEEVELVGLVREVKEER
ncbi:hypothetical protein HK405_000643, partial [Cladochytrium tenue]